MKLKDLVGKELLLTIVYDDLFTEKDIEDFGEDYEVSQEQIDSRVKRCIANHDIEVNEYVDYKFRD